MLIPDQCVHACFGTMSHLWAIKYIYQLLKDYYDPQHTSILKLAKETYEHPIEITKKNGYIYVTKLDVMIWSNDSEVNVPHGLLINDDVIRFYARKNELNLINNSSCNRVYYDVRLNIMYYINMIVSKEILFRILIEDDYYVVITKEFNIEIRMRSNPLYVDNLGFIPGINIPLDGKNVYIISI